MYKQALRFVIILLVLGISNNIFAQVPAPVKLTASLKTSTSVSAVILTWERAATGGDVLFNVYKKEGGLADASAFTKIASGVKERAFVDMKVENSKTYSYYVTAYNNTTESEPSNKVEITVTAPVRQIGFIAGVLTNETTKAPIVGGKVAFYLKNMTTMPGNETSLVVKTDSMGYFKAELKTGEYIVFASALSYLGEYYDNVKTIIDAKPVKVAVGETTNIAVELASFVPPVIEKGIVKGVLTDEITKSAISGGTIAFIPKIANSTVMGAEGQLVVKTDSKGEFTAELKAGDYYVQSYAAKYKAEFYDNVKSRSDAKPITVVKNETITLAIDLTPETPVVIQKGVIKGVLTDEVSNAPIKGGLVVFTPITPLLESSMLTVKTDENGKFSAVLRAGNYIMRSQAPAYKKEFFDNVTDETKATVIELKAGDTLVCNAALTPEPQPSTYTISGSVKTSAGNPLSALVCIYKTNKTRYDAVSCNINSVKTDDAGNFSLKVLENDTVVVFAQPFDRSFTPKYFDNKTTFQEADKLVASQNISNVNFVFTPKPVFNNGISGKVVDSANTAVVANVAAVKLGTVGKEWGKVAVITDEKGIFSIKNLEPGKYLLMVIPRPGYLPGYYQVDGTTTIKRSEADTLLITETTIIENVTFVVSKVKVKGSGMIAGKVRDNAGSNINGAITYAVNSYGEVLTYGISDETGSYSLEALNTDNYTIYTDLLNYSSGNISDISVDENSSEMPYVLITMYPDKVTDVKVQETLPADYKLMQNYPNPFNPSTLIKYSIPEAGVVSIKVFDILGNEVTTLVNQFKQAGNYSVKFDASNLSSGIYLYQMKAGKSIQTKKLMLLK